MAPMNLGSVAERVRAGETVSFRAYGNSMTPRIHPGDMVAVRPRGEEKVKKGDVVLAQVNGRWFLHLVTGLKPAQVKISNNHGHVNGWTNIANVVGVLTNWRPSDYS